jgi:hypothetical protein
MSNPLVTPNMSLTAPGIGNTLSPLWAQNLNDDLNTIDQHNHSPGSGVQITPAGLNINVDLPINAHNITKVNSLLFNGAVTGTPAVLSIYSNGTDFFFKDINGNPIQLTKAGGPNAGTGNIQNLPSTPIGGAGISWINGQSTFQFLADSGTVGANTDQGSVVLRYPGSYPSPSGTNWIALEVPSAISSGYSLILPLSLPGSTLPVQLTNAGNLITGQITGTQIVTNVLLSGAVVVGTSLQVTSGGPILTNSSGELSINANFSSSGLIECANGIYPGFAVTNAGLGAQNANTLIAIDPGTNSKYPVVTSPPSSHNGLVIIRGVVGPTGTILAGEGFTVSHVTTGTYNIFFTDPLTDSCAPSATINDIIGGGLMSIYCPKANIGPNSFEVIVYTGANPAATADCQFSFIAVGQRNG